MFSQRLITKDKAIGEAYAALSELFEIAKENKMIDKGFMVPDNYTTVGNTNITDRNSGEKSMDQIIRDFSEISEYLSEKVTKGIAQRMATTSLEKKQVATAIKNVNTNLNNLLKNGNKGTQLWAQLMPIIAKIRIALEGLSDTMTNFYRNTSCLKR